MERQDWLGCERSRIGRRGVEWLGRIRLARPGIVREVMDRQPRLAKDRAGEETVGVAGTAWLAVASERSEQKGMAAMEETGLG